jgi:PhnB protein
MATNYIAPGMTAVTPYLFVEGAEKAIAYYGEVLGAKLRYKIPGEGGKVMHAEIEIDKAVIMMGEPNGSYGGVSPRKLKGRAAGLYVYVKDVDATLKKAEQSGSTIAMPAATMFYGDRVGGFIDPFGHFWTVGTHVEDVAPDEMDRRAKEWAKQASTQS